MKNNKDSSSLSHHRNHKNNNHHHDPCQKPCHRSNKQIHDDHQRHKTVKITFFLSDKTKQKRYSWTRVLKGTVHHPPTALEPCQQEELPAVDLLSYLPPRSYNTKKRSRRYLIHHGVSNNKSRGSVEKSMELSSNVTEGKADIESHNELGPRVVRNFDLNELPSNDVADE